MSLNGNVISVLDIFPVGYIYISAASTNPGDLFGGTWTPLNEGRVLIGANDTYPAGSTGGETTHTLTENEMPSHTHGRGTMEITGSFATGKSGHNSNGVVATGAFTESSNSGLPGNNASTSGSTRLFTFTASRSWEGETSEVGGSQAHNIMQPYLAVYMWQRIA